jgi:5-methylcytosine-specific restriction endonuclease McrA
MEEGKICGKCGEWKAFSEFYKNANYSSGYESYCKPCKLEHSKKKYNENVEINRLKRKLTTYKYRQENTEQYKKVEKKYREKNAERIRDYKKQYYQENKEQIKKLRKRYYQPYSSEQAKQHYQRNAEQIKKRRRERYEENKEQVKEQARQYYQENKDKLNRQGRQHYTKQYYQENAERIRKHNKQWRKSEKGRESVYKGAIKRRSLKANVIFKPHERKQILERDKWQCQLCGIKVHDRSSGDWNTPDKAHIDHIIPISKGGNSEPNNLQTLCRTCNLSKSDKVELQLSLL